MDMNKQTPQIFIGSQPQSGNRSPKFKGIGHWNAYIKSPSYLSFVPDDRLITAKELAEHNTDNDMWMAFRNGSTVEVYDVTPFLEYHPGGRQILAEHGGTDATEPFRCAHAYISLNMISRLKKGRLVPHSGPKPSQNFLTPRMNVLPPSQIKRNLPVKPMLDWFLSPDKTRIILSFKFNQELITLDSQLHAMATIKQDENDPERTVLNMWILLKKAFYSFKLKLLPGLRPCLDKMEVSPSSFHIRDPSAYVSVKFNDASSCQRNLSAVGSILQEKVVEFSNLPDLDDYLDCEVISSSFDSNRIYRFIRLRWPVTASHIPIPFLSHVYVRIKDSKGEEHIRPYTPTCVTLLHDADHQVSGPADISYFDILVKIYENGIVSRMLNCVTVGSTLRVSLPRCSLSSSVLVERIVNPVCGDSFRPWKNMCILCAGSGITPFTPLIKFLLSSPPDHRISLLWFNRCHADLVLYDDFVSFVSERFKQQFWLSDERDLFSPYHRSGTIENIKSRQFFATNVAMPVESTLVLICGPPGFNLAAKSVTEEWNIKQDNVYIL
nr:cytochrome b5 reductase 4 [Hymenolepis microstoma]